MIDPTSDAPFTPAFAAEVLGYATRQDAEAATLRELGALIRAAELARCANLLRTLVAMRTGVEHIALLVATRCRALAREQTATPADDVALRLAVYEEARHFLEGLAGVAAL